MHRAVGQGLWWGDHTQIHINLHILSFLRIHRTGTAIVIPFLGPEKGQGVGDTVIRAAIVRHTGKILHARRQFVAKLGNLRQDNRARVARGDLANVHHTFDILAAVTEQMYGAALQQRHDLFHQQGVALEHGTVVKVHRRVGGGAVRGIASLVGGRACGGGWIMVNRGAAASLFFRAVCAL